MWLLAVRNTCILAIVDITRNLQEGGNPNIEGRDGSVPLMVCLVPLINKDPLHHFSHLMKVPFRYFVSGVTSTQFHENHVNEGSLSIRFAWFTASIYA